MEFLRHNTKRPVPLPKDLPIGLRLDPEEGLILTTIDRQQSAQLNLLFGRGGHLIIQYGVAVFDGCGADLAVPTRVAGQPALIYESESTRWTEVIWPATAAHPEGRYGLAGSLSKDRMIALAESMGPAASAPGDGSC